MPRVKMFKERIEGIDIETPINVNNKTGEFSIELPLFMQEDKRFVTMLTNNSLPRLESEFRSTVKEFVAEGDKVDYVIQVEFAVSGNYAIGSNFDRSGFSEYCDYIKLKSKVLAKVENPISKRNVWWHAYYTKENGLRKTHNRVLDLGGRDPRGVLLPWNPDAWEQLQQAEELFKKVAKQIGGVLSQEPDKILETLLSSKLLGDGK